MIQMDAIEFVMRIPAITTFILGTPIGKGPPGLSHDVFEALGFLVHCFSCSNNELLIFLTSMCLSNINSHGIYI